MCGMGPYQFWFDLLEINTRLSAIIIGTTITFASDHFCITFYNMYYTTQIKR